MSFLILPTFDSLVFDASSFISMHPAVVHEVGSHTLAHVLYSFIKRTCHRKGLSRREIRKIIHRRNRWFVDNIIMHHKRLHDLNRQLIINNARKNALSRSSNINHIKKEDKNNESNFNSISNNDVNDKSNYNHNFSSNNGSNKSRTEELILRIKLKKRRARSRWVANFSSNFIADDMDD